MKFIHNFFQMFRKDSGAHFTYNLGVGFMRLFLFFLMLILVFSLPIVMQPSNKLTYQDKIIAQVGAVRKSPHSRTRRDNNGDMTHIEYYDYFVSFGGVRSNGEFFSYDQTIPEYMYQYYKEIEGEGNKEYFLYRCDAASCYYVSPSSLDDAQEEFNQVYLSPLLPAATAAIYVCIFLALISLAIGIGEIRVSMKYPRSDVPMTETAITPEQAKYTEELMKEFDEAYKRYTESRKSGAPADAPSKALPDCSEAENGE